MQYWRVQKENHSLPEQKPLTRHRTVPDKENLNSSLKAQCGQDQESKTPGRPNHLGVRGGHDCGRFLLRVRPGSHSEY